MANKDSSRTVNLLWSTQLMTLALVASLWFDRLGEFEAGLNIAAFIIVAAWLVLFSPEIGRIWNAVRGVFNAN